MEVTDDQRILIEFGVDVEYVRKQIEITKSSTDWGDFIYAVLQRFGRYLTPLDYSEINHTEYKSGQYPGILSIYAIDHVIRAFKEVFHNFVMHSVIPASAMKKNGH